MSHSIDNDSYDEYTLVFLLKQKKEEAFRTLIRYYHTRLFRIAYGITLDREESLDIVQEVFLKVFQNIDTFREESKLSTWLYRITINLCLNWQRKWKRKFRWHHQSLERDDVDTYRQLGTDEYHPETIYEKKEFEQKFRQTLKKLPEEARVILVLKEVEGLSYDAIAKNLNIKKGTVSSRLFYARKMLRKSLKQYLKEEEKKKGENDETQEI
ncbi:MAG: sigma-70 family RNA polymerase sigma factor [Thermodesulfobacteriota bacterium]|nr:sigma-70 family RNA polymerase sigma factor [Thermodesulfobacteriota bacterium]